MNFSCQVEIPRLLLQIRPQLSLSHENQMRTRIGRRARGERFQQQRMVFLRSESRHAHKKNIAVLESLLCPPLLPRSLGIRIKVRWNAIRNHTAASDSI